MDIRILSNEEFNSFQRNHPLKNFMQSIDYGKVMSEIGYGYELIGLVSDKSVLAASLILTKVSDFGFKYAYAPKGFLVDYYDDDLLTTFTEKIKKHYQNEGYVFIKINPEIVVGEVNNKTFEFTSNPNFDFKKSLTKYGYKKLKDNLYFESKCPRFNAYIDLANTSIEDYSKSNRNKVKNSLKKGLYMTLGTFDDLETVYNLSEKRYDLDFYRFLYNVFSEKIDIILIKINYEEYIKQTQAIHDEEFEKNKLYNEIIHRSNEPKDINRKMESDVLLDKLKEDIVLATNGLKENNNQVVAAALVLKDDTRVHIIDSGFNKELKYNQNYFLYDSIINHYKFDYMFLDIGGVSGDFNTGSKYHGLNRFKCGFNPHIYEFIGEFDLLINERRYNKLWNSGKLALELNKKD